MRVKPIQLVYKAGFYQNSNHNKKGALRFSDATWCRTNGNGFYWLGKNAKYMLTVKTETDIIIPIDVKWMFGKVGIVLSKNKRNLLESNLPQYFEIEYDDCCKSYYIVWEDFYKWIKVVEINKKQ